MTFSSKLKSLSFILFILTLSANSMAGDRCLENASNRDLVFELESRLDRGSNNGEGGGRGEKPLKEFASLNIENLDYTTINLVMINLSLRGQFIFTKS